MLFLSHARKSSNVVSLLVLITSPLAAAGPCDIYKSGGTDCVAAHSTVRALYSSFSGPLYQVIRGSDNTTADIPPLSAGGVANAGKQDSFCASTTCLIQKIYDQSGNGNHLTRAPPGGFNGPSIGGYDDLASAIGAPVTLNGHKAYGVFISPGTGYRIDKGKGVATGDAAEGMYAVLDGTHYNDQCCFDYGNAETNNKDTGAGHMEAIYYGTCTVWGKGAGSGPWIMADLENGLFSGYGAGENTADPTQTSRFLTSVLKGEPNRWALRGGNAASGSLSTYYNGVRPKGYEKMSKEGSIILGIGGDNSNGAQGTFYEGVMVTGYPSDATEASVQSDIVAAKYATASLTSGPALGNTASLRLTTPGYDTRYITHSGGDIQTAVVTSSDSTADKKRASWKVVTGLGNSACYSFESVDTPGSYIRHQAFALKLVASDGSKQFKEDATFCPQTPLSSAGTHSIRAWGYPTRYFRYYNNGVFLASNGGVQEFDNPSGFNQDVSFEVKAALA
ncbi:Alpha-L-arabinofuranosidase B (ABFB) domain [Teratosphaeria destructans]|uniref:Alpha-L-arabinofuranosidase n=1 Tax=Teratosphaeria destructans TaxID=418781 RepID=A0A9W7SJE3_9PEZI|nr:Alpha-L-arabinofuranosidase B (ABFB) domain [Teratosphaeria destructans]